MKIPCLFNPSLLRVTAVPILLLTLALRAQETPPAPTAPAPDVKPAETAPASPPESTPAPAPSGEVVAPEPAPAAEPVPEVPAEAPDDRELRRLDIETPKAPEPVDATAAVEAGPETPKVEAPREEKKPSRRHSGGGREMVAIRDDALLSAGESVSKIVAIFGDVIVDGDVDGEAVAVMGDVTINGTVGRETVAVLGNVTINGQVDGEVVAVLGGVQLGPKAVVNGEIVTVGGGLDKAPGAIVKRSVQQIPFLGSKLPRTDWLRSWVRDCVLWGRPLWFGPHLGWLWGISLSFLAFYLFLALVFGRAATKCAETFERKPGQTILASFLAALLMPVLLVVLAITGVGPVILLLAAFVGVLFGKAALLVWLGRRYGLQLPVLAALAGGVTLFALYLVPILGFLLWGFTGLLGFGLVVYTLISGARNGRPPAPAPAMAAASPMVGGSVVLPASASASASAYQVPTAEGLPAGAAGVPPSVMPPPLTAPMPPPVMPAVSAASLERAGFWLRFMAAALDVILVGVAAGFFNLDQFFLLLLSAYSVVLWKLKGTTIGGIVCGLKLVRLDDRPIDWTTAIVRALSCVLSVVVVFLGFIWVAFDPEKQSWHDKIAGTTIVRVPKGVSLV